MNNVNSEIKKVVGRVKEAQVQLQSLVKSHDWVAEARNYAERQGKEVKKLFGPDVEKIKVFLEKERKELERIQKNIPGEVKKFRKFMDMQKKEFERLLASLRKLPKNTAKKKAKNKKSAGSTKKKASSKVAKAAAASAETSANH